MEAYAKELPAWTFQPTEVSGSAPAAVAIIVAEIVLKVHMVDMRTAVPRCVFT